MPDETNLLGERAYLTLPSHAALPGSDRLRVGLAWAGNPHHKNDANRSIAWEQFATLTELDGGDFFSLQVRGLAPPTAAVPKSFHSRVNSTTSPPRQPS